MDNSQGRVDEFGFTHYNDGSFLDPKGYFYDRNGNGEDGSFYDRNWVYHPPRRQNYRQQDKLLDDFNDMLEGDDEDFDDDPLYQEFLSQGGGAFEKNIKNHSYPATVVIRDLSSTLNREKFQEYLNKNRILSNPIFHPNEVVFRVATYEEAESFLEIVGHKFDGADYKVEIHDKSYKTFGQKTKEESSWRQKKDEGTKVVKQNQRENDNRTDEQSL